MRGCGRCRGVCSGRKATLIRELPLVLALTVVASAGLTWAEAPDDVDNASPGVLTVLRVQAPTHAAHPDRPAKKDVFAALLQEGWVHVYLDPRRPGVVVPRRFARQPQLLLAYGNNMPVPIPDLRFDDRGIRATLSFARRPHRTFVPWTAVYAITRPDGSGTYY
jgi:hypothetical protein